MGCEVGLRSSFDLHGLPPLQPVNFCVERGVVTRHSCHGSTLVSNSHELGPVVFFEFTFLMGCRIADVEGVEIQGWE